MSKRKCRKCGEAIPNRIKIDDVFKNLQNRKFCLKCSPYGGHNTSPHDPVERRKKKGAKWGEYSEEQKKRVTLSLYKRALTRKHEFIGRLGGKCKSCGYDKSWRALSFHHKTSDDKKFDLTLNMLWSQKWEKIEEEVAKCELLCLNCHAELGQKTKVDIIRLVNEKYGTNFK